MSGIPTYPKLKSLGSLSIETFLAEYWQKKPVLIRQALPNFTSPLSADELAGLSLEEDATSRLIVESKTQSGSDHTSSHWQLKHGPFEETEFSQLPTSHWTLLVQHVDSLDPEINALLNAFRFIPRWRLEDIMISYAADQGSVGPHFDYYDVFLLQAQGQRRWKIGQHCDANSPLLANQDMKVLQGFDQEEEWVLDPGDVLYIPPNVAHWGIAEGECMTYSIGFRAPSHADALLDFVRKRLLAFLKTNVMEIQTLARKH